VVEDGINLTTSFATYLIPTAADVPERARRRRRVRRGARSLQRARHREPPSAARRAIANAIEDATGARITRLPITAERVARALGLLG